MELITPTGLERTSGRRGGFMIMHSLRCYLPKTVHDHEVTREVRSRGGLLAAYLEADAAIAAVTSEMVLIWSIVYTACRQSAEGQVPA